MFARISRGLLELLEIWQRRGGRCSKNKRDYGMACPDEARRGAVVEAREPQLTFPCEFTPLTSRDLRAFSSRKKKVIVYKSIEAKTKCFLYTAV